MEIDTADTDKANSFIIKATNVPHEFFQNRNVAKSYFRRFGKVKLVMFKPKRNCLLIEYANEDGMLNALDVGGEYNGHVFGIVRDTETAIRKKVKKNPDPDWVADPEVRAELEAMGAFGPKRTYDLRPEAMSVDAPGETLQSKTKQRRWKASSASPKPQKKKAVTVKESQNSPEQSELYNIIKQQAMTVEDKYKILDARDKLIRTKLKKNVEITKVKATVGTCPDMCPEKERLMREIQHQVALYEQEDGGKCMNPKWAVKQYSRSSADQESPLPQELRPVSVLQMTMGYLMHRIMGLCENPDVNMAEWYHFLWDRTRGIRKDITQQELCSQGSVELVEQCARFHIFCSARLVAEDPSVFDQKINTENLTKCLQTLKYMYHDLQLKGESCENEPEFRAYIILLNLNDGNFMWEVQQLKKDIQESKEVKFALEVYSSIDKHNYVKFFKLVNSTTFLNSCILMRYFIQIRISALKILLKSYSPRISQTSLPIHYLTRVLSFENNESTIEFLESYGLYTDVSRTRIILDKPSFQPPDLPFVLDRAVNLVESKRKQSVGEVICGRALPPKIYEDHVLQNSFDSDGYLKLPPELEDSEPIKPPEKKEETPRNFSSPITVQNVFMSPKQSIFAPKVESKSIWNATPTTATNIFGGVTVPTGIFGGEITPIVPTQEIEVPKIVVENDEKEKEDAERRRREEEEVRRRREEEERRVEEENRRRELEEEARRKEELRLERLREEERRKLEEAAIRRRLEEQKKRELEKRKNIEIKAAVCNVINDLLDDVEENVKTIKLNEIKRKIHVRKMRKILTKWRENTRRKRKRKAIDFNPLWFGGRSIQKEAEELLTESQILTLQNMKRYKRGKPTEIQVDDDDDVVKIDLTELTYKLLTKKFVEIEMKLQNELFWKVIISLPNELEYDCGLNHVEKVLDNYIKWKKRGNTTVMIDQSKSFPTITYCLEKQKGLLINNRNETNGFIFLANDFNENLIKRIFGNFKNFGLNVKIPVVFILQNYNEQKYLKTLTSEGIISDYLILVDKFTSKNLINLVEEALIFLSTRVEKSPPLEMETLKSFLTKYLCNDLWKRANSFAKWNSNYKNCLKMPNTVIYLHNEALARLKKILTDETSQEFLKFPEIFKDFLRNQIPDSLPCDYKYFPNFCHAPTYLKHIETVLDNLKFPNFLEDWPPNNQLQLETAISKYCTQIFKDSQKCFYKIMSILLRDVDPNVNFKDVANVVWTDVVELMTLEKLNETDFSLYGTGFVNKSVYNQLIVVYNVCLLNDQVKSDWFYINNPIIKQKILQLLEEHEEEIEVEAQHIDVEELDLDKILAKIQEPRKLNVGKIKNEITSCKRLLTDLEDTVVIHRKILEKSGHILKTIMEQ